jgi:hypothetical protein
MDKSLRKDRLYKSDNEESKNHESCNFNWYSDGDEEADILDFLEGINVEDWFSLEELEELEDFQNGKIKLFVENGEVLGYNKEKDVYYRINLDPSFLAFDF